MSTKDAASKTTQFNITKILVALRADEVVDYTAESLVITRALDLADKFGAGLHFCDVVQKPIPLSTPLMLASRATDPLASALTTAEAKMRKLVEHVRSAGLEDVSGSVVLDKPRAEGFIQKAEEVHADLILKQSREERFVLGLLSNTDWDLLRDSSVPVWLTSSEINPAAGVMAAIECRLDEGEDRKLYLDHRVFEASKILSDRYAAPIHLIHTYQVEGMGAYYPIYPEAGVSAAALDQIHEHVEEDRERIARMHGNAIQTFVDESGVPLDEILVVEGETASTIKHHAEEQKVGVIVMGAEDDISRWDRLLRTTHAEATLDDAPCDILFIH